MNALDRSMLGVDTNVLMHAYREKCLNGEQEEWQRKSQGILKQLFNDQIPVCVSAISVSEYLVGINEADRPKVASKLSETFSIAPFNNRAAIIAAGLVKTAKSLLSGVRNERPVLMADTKIIASLIAHGCTRCETLDKNFATIASTVMKKVNQLTVQPDLPGFDLPPEKKRSR